jgi:lysyl-tRNA synthetase class I
MILVVRYIQLTNKPTRSKQLSFLFFQEYLWSLKEYQKSYSFYFGFKRANEKLTEQNIQGRMQGHFKYMTRLHNG